jgi:uncharacterized protein (DUF1684 family)
MTHEHTQNDEHQHTHGDAHENVHGDEHEHEHQHEHEHHHEHAHEHEHVHMSRQEYATALRAAKDEYMREDPTSPLGKQERSRFDGLTYFPYDPALALELPLDRNVDSEPVEMGTSTGDTRAYARVGKVHFDVRGTPAEVTLYGDPENLFLPIRDATSGHATYGAGRYVEPEMTGDDTVFVDFNLLYNPYCAYNEQFSCPLPPVENWLQVPIEAGEQNYKAPDAKI